ncbi:MAG: DUF4296 domain-containing protein [Bacteroidetes bacterium]|jgi:hypothetical protein|nr:DUF4296 domain-containing protein [Bacteroidota bacterium]
MLKVSYIILFSLFVFVSCNKEAGKAEKPSDLLDKNKMAAILTDISLMEAAANIQVTQNANAPIEENLKFNIYKQHLITRAQYETSLKYYSANAKEFKEVYDIVLQNLNKQKGN